MSEKILPGFSLRPPASNFVALNDAVDAADADAVDDVTDAASSL